MIWLLQFNMAIGSVMNYTCLYPERLFLVVKEAVLLAMREERWMIQQPQYSTYVIPSVWCYGREQKTDKETNFPGTPVTVRKTYQG